VLMDAAGGLAVTFHRAFDHLPDPEEALEVLGEEGVARVLTGGGPGTAWEGRDALAALVAASLAAPDLPRILGAGGIRAGHAAALLRHTGLREIHARASAYPALARAVVKAPSGG
ncbi:MAG TPA: copper homeostasis protein CutC, partial [Longimicrobiales bacterium]|nr:copper homeostasis protein CutC [Longimicrobiales bacterium]